MVGLQPNNCKRDRVRVLLVWDLRTMAYGKAVHSAKEVKELSMVQRENAASSSSGSCLGTDDLDAFDLDCDEALERISKKRTKNKAKTTKPNMEWKRL
ncbi:hypothetical protein Tco_0855214 [Tanacetum coccineum]